MSRSKSFTFDGGAATFVGTALLAMLVTVLTLGICYPYALVLRQRWRAKHTYVYGHRLTFTGKATGLFLHWLKWWALSVITLGVYLFWVGPRSTQWVVEHTDFDPSYTPPGSVPIQPGSTVMPAIGFPAYQPDPGAGR